MAGESPTKRPPVSDGDKVKHLVTAALNACHGDVPHAISILAAAAGIFGFSQGATKGAIRALVDDAFDAAAMGALERKH